jgi:hypothetical protein
MQSGNPTWQARPPSGPADTAAGPCTTAVKTTMRRLGPRPYSSKAQQPMRATVVLSRQPHTRYAPLFDREQRRAGSLHPGGQAKARPERSNQVRPPGCRRGEPSGPASDLERDRPRGSHRRDGMTNPVRSNGSLIGMHESKHGSVVRCQRVMGRQTASGQPCRWFIDPDVIDQHRLRKGH